MKQWPKTVTVTFRGRKSAFYAHSHNLQPNLPLTAKYCCSLTKPPDVSVIGCQRSSSHLLFMHHFLCDTFILPMNECTLEMGLPWWGFLLLKLVQVEL